MVTMPKFYSVNGTNEILIKIMLSGNDYQIKASPVKNFTGLGIKLQNGNFYLLH